MDVSVLNTVGLMLGILGVVVIYEWGPPQPSYEAGFYMKLEECTPVTEEEVALLKQKAAARVMSAVGLVLIGLGFAFQLAAVWVPYV